MTAHARPKWLSIALYFGLGALAVLLILGFAAQWRFGALLSAPKVDRNVFIGDAGVYGVVDPETVQPLIAEFAAEKLGQSPPAWVVQRFLPYSGGAAARLDFDTQQVDLALYLNPRRLLPEIERRTRGADLARIAPEITWHNPAVARPTPGVLSLLGSVPMEPEAEDAFWYTWNQSFRPPPLSLEGDHFIEILMDNRKGQAYLVAASLLLAYDIDLDAQEQDISLSSLQFVEVARTTVDFHPPDRFSMRLVLDIQPDAVERLGVINLKVAIEDGFEEWGHRWRKHGIEFTGESRWRDTAIVYDYDLKPALKFLELAIDGQLF